jgi:cation:H+ antiporter
MAIGDLLGSNLFNILILSIDDVFYRAGDLLSSISSIHLFTAISATIMTGITVIGLFLRSRRQILNRFGWPSIFLLLVYLVNGGILYFHSNSNEKGIGVEEPSAALHTTGSAVDASLAMRPSSACLVC